MLRVLKKKIEFSKQVFQYMYQDFSEVGEDCACLLL